MQVEIKRSDVQVRFPGEEIIGATFTDGTETLILSVVKLGWTTRGTLFTDDGLRSWSHNSVAAINLLILHAREFVTVRELLEDLGECDESRLLRAAK